MDEFLIYFAFGFVTALLMLWLIGRLTEDPTEKAPEHYCIGCDKLEMIRGNNVECRMYGETLKDVRFCWYRSEEVHDDGV